MTLQKLRPGGDAIEKEIRALLQCEGTPAPSKDACKQWARDFIVAHVPSWHPGKAMTVKQAQLVGRAYMQLMGRPIPKAPRQEPTRRKKQK